MEELKVMNTEVEELEPENESRRFPRIPVRALCSRGSSAASSLTLLSAEQEAQGVHRRKAHRPEGCGSRPGYGGTEEDGGDDESDS